MSRAHFYKFKTVFKYIWRHYAGEVLFCISAMIINIIFGAIAIVAVILLSKSKEQQIKMREKLAKSYVVVDIETTGLSPHKDEIIELSAVKVLNNEIIDTFSTLINPKGKISKKASEINGITNDMVEQAPKIKDVLSDFINFIGDEILISHNASFDLSFICRDCRLNGINFTPFYVDTLSHARKTLHLDNYKLANLAKHYKIKEQQEHRALADCKMLHQCFCNMSKEKIFIGKYINNINLNAVEFKIDAAKIKSGTDNIYSNNPFYKQNCVITGDFRYSKETMFQKIANCGGICQNNVTLKTNVLIVGKNPGKTKLERAKELNKTKNLDIKIVSEAEFFDLINDNNSMPE